MPEPHPARASAWRRNLLRLALIVAVGAATWWMSDYLAMEAEELQPGALAMRRGMLALVLASYALLIALPFVPAVEIGLTMIAMGGPDLAPFVYAATVAGLVTAFLMGLWLPLPALCRLLEDLRLHRLSAQLKAIAPLGPEARVAALRARLPRWLSPLAGSGRYLLLALLVNLPGSTLIGGGGGICLMAGLSGLFRPFPTLVVLALAVMPLPLGIWLWWPGLG